MTERDLRQRCGNFDRCDLNIHAENKEKEMSQEFWTTIALLAGAALISSF
jgi:hypothetical protein